MSNKISWSEQYKHPNWQKKRLEALEYANWECANCGDKDRTLNVHHRIYVKGRKVWEYHASELMVLCEPCHEAEHHDKALLNEIIAQCGPRGVQVIACLVAGYFDANCQLDQGSGASAKESDPGYYELGIAASCLEAGGRTAWQKVIRDHVASKPSTPVMEQIIEEWDKGY